MTILVTGATGRLGARIVERLLGEGRSVRILTRRPFAADRAFGGHVEMVEWHPFSEAFPVAALANVDQVIHLMGAPYAARANKRQLAAAHQARLHVTQSVVSALAERRVRLVVASLAVPPSGTPAHGETAAEAPSTQSPCPPGLEADVRAIEQVVLDARTRGLNVAVLRLGLLLAPNPVWTRLVALAEYGLVLPLAGSIIPVIDPDDAATMLAGLLARSDLDGVFNGVAPIPLTGVSVLELLRGVQRLPLSCPVPRRLARRMLGSLAPVLLATSPIPPKRLVDAGARFAHPDPLFRVASLLGKIAEQRRNARAWRVLPRRTSPTPAPMPERSTEKASGEPSAT